MIEFTPEDFEIRPEYFMHPSLLHDKLHTYRVMIHVLLLGKKRKLADETKIAFCAAFVHDMARKHDGFCLMHGPRAARQKVPEFLPLFHKYGLGPSEINALKTAVSNHSQYFELRKNHPHYLVTALLKDADALDRIRMGTNNLNPRFLRFPETLEMMDFSHQLYFQTNQQEDLSLRQILDIAEKLSKEKLYMTV